MRSVNKVTLLGNVGTDPEAKALGSGTTLVKLSIATNEAWTDKNGQKQERTQWHRCAAFGKVAEIIQQYVRKGDRIYVEGRVEYSQTETDGVTKYWTEIVIQDLVMLGGGDRAETPAEPRTARRGTGMDAGSYKRASDDTDGLPF